MNLVGREAAGGRNFAASVAIFFLRSRKRIGERVCWYFGSLEINYRDPPNNKENVINEEVLARLLGQ